MMSPYMAMLPDEVILRIIELASATPDALDAHNTARIIQLGTLCKAWRGPSIRVLYHTIDVRHAGQALALYSVVSFSRPHYGDLVRTLDTHDVFEEGRPHGLKALLRCLPNLRQLSVSLHQILDLSDIPQWDRLDHLIVRRSEIEDEEDEEDFSDLKFPPLLRTLHLSWCRSLIEHRRPWANVALANLETLILERIAPSERGPQQILTEDRLLPKMPDLRKFQANICCRGPRSEAMLMKLIKETSSTLRHLVLTHKRAYGNGFISPNFLTHLKKLEILEYAGQVQDFTLTNSRLFSHPPFAGSASATEGPLPRLCTCFKLCRTKTSCQI